MPRLLGQRTMPDKSASLIGPPVQRGAVSRSVGLGQVVSASWFTEWLVLSCQSVMSSERGRLSGKVWAVPRDGGHAQTVPLELFGPLPRSLDMPGKDGSV